MLDLSSRLYKIQIGGIALVAFSNLLTFIGVITPAWQVAEDRDVNRYVQSGLWLYCPGASQCWYIFSDNLINYYERVDVCRFLLIGDCRKKLLRTPYFFGWHYAVLILLLISLAFGSAALAAAAIGFCKKQKLKITTIVYDVCIFCSFLTLAVGLTVFVINAEMLESKYLIGVKNTFEKQYGYSFYLAGVGLFVLVFASLAAILLTTFVFFGDQRRPPPEYFHNRLSTPTTMRQSQYISEKQPYPVLSQTPHQQYYQDGPPSSVLGSRLDAHLVSDPQRSVTPLSIATTTHGNYIQPDFRNGQFQPTTRHFLSY